MQLALRLLALLIMSPLAAQIADVVAEATPPGDNVARASIAEVVVYKTIGDRDLKLFVDKPPGWQPSDRRPAIVLFHGGGFVWGTPELLRLQSEYLASRGMVALRVEYRLIPKGDEGPPTLCINDAKSAMRWVRKHAGSWGIDPQRIAAGGGSAGGHLAAFTALVGGLDDPADDLSISPKPQALVLFNPVLNNGPEQWGYKRVGARYREFSPAHHVTADAPPTIIFLGTKDKLIPVVTIQAFREEMIAVGVRCEAIFYEGEEHGFFNRNPARTKTLIETDEFLASLGWLSGEPTLTPPKAK